MKVQDYLRELAAAQAFSILNGSIINEGKRAGAARDLLLELSVSSTDR